MSFAKSKGSYGDEPHGLSFVGCSRTRTLDDILINHLSKEEILAYKNGNTSISSVTVYAEKPLADQPKICIPGGGCC